MQDLTITSNAGLTVELADLGARIVDVRITKQGEEFSVARGYKTVDAYQRDQFYVGATVGPIANRIRHGQLRIHNQDVQLPKNHHGHCLHSGNLGFDQRTWKVSAQSTHQVCFQLLAAQASGSLPCNLIATATYTVSGHCLDVAYEVHTDTDTYLNLTNHTYWNLNRDCAPIHDHLFELYAHAYANKDEFDLPDGTLNSISSPYSYSLTDPQAPKDLRGQVDHHFVVDEQSDKLKLMAKVSNAARDLVLEVSSTKPGFQLYSGHFLGPPLTPFAGFCVEPQYLPDAINLSGFKAPIVTPQTPYFHHISYRLVSG